MRQVYIGFDPKEERSFDVCAESIRKHWSLPVDIIPLVQRKLRLAGLYWRTHENNIDWIDGKPFSSEFTFTRFLVPQLNQYRGWALFCDADMMFRADVNDLFDFADDRYAVMCVQHRQESNYGTKKMGAVQEGYSRKNWSSLVLWNCAHPANENLTTADVSQKPGRWLHGFSWLKDDEIGALPEEWNWLEGHSSDWIEPKNVHFTRGAPWMPGYEGVDYADEWRSYEGPR